MSSKSYPDSTAVDYVYDLANKVLQVSDPTGIYGFAYDNMGRLISTTTQYAFVAGTNTNSYSYDAASNRTSLTAPDGSVTTYAYDTDNRLNTLANTWAGSFGFAYDALSRRTQLTRPNGIATNYSYDSVSHLLSVLHQAGVNTLDGASYTYDAAGNRTAKTNYLNSITSNYTYDPLYELTQVTQGTSTTESYSYDAVGNRLSSSGVSTYSYNSSNELISNSNGSYTYDANGNTLSDAEGRSFTWDFENRLLQVVVPGTNAGITTFKYDPLGRRIQKSGPMGTTNYFYDLENDIEETNSTGSPVVRYADGQNIDEVLAESRSGTIALYEQDGIASVSSLTNASGVVSNTYMYDSFGDLTASSGTVTNPFQYTGRDYDPETGLRYYRARYYDPVAGQFISEDPTMFGGGVNFYRYGANSPINGFDPLGLSFWSCFGRGLGHGVVATSVAVIVTTAIVAAAPEAAAVVTGVTLVAGATGLASTGISLVRNPSANNVGYNLGALPGSAAAGGIYGNAVAGALSPPDFQPPDEIPTLWKNAWRDSNGNVNPLAFFKHWAFGNPDGVDPMKTGPDFWGAAGGIAGEGTGASNLAGGNCDCK